MSVLLSPFCHSPLVVVLMNVSDLWWRQGLRVQFHLLLDFNDRGFGAVLCDREHLHSRLSTVEKWKTPGGQ